MTELPFDVSKLPDPNFRAPDLVGTIEGWRAWQVHVEPPQFGTAPKLYSVTQSTYYWIPRQTAEARCDKRRKKGKPHHIPEEACSCGFYTARDLAHLLTMGYHQYDGESRFCVIGQVANWGKVIEGNLGWRSQFAYPARLFIPFEAWRLAKPLEKAYGVPVELKNILAPAASQAA